MEINKFNQTMKYLTRPAERPARILSDDPIETPPVFKTSDPKEAIKEVIRRTEGPVPGIGIAPGISFNPLGTVEDQDPSLTGKFGVGGGELEFGVKEDEGFIGFRKEFEEGGVIGEDGMFEGEDLGTREGFAEIKTKGVIKLRDLAKLFEEYGIDISPRNIAARVKNYGIKRPKNVTVEYREGPGNKYRKTVALKNPKAFYIKPTVSELKQIKKQYDMKQLKFFRGGAGKEAFKKREARAKELLKEGKTQTEANKILKKEFNIKSMSSTLEKLSKELKKEGVKIKSGRESEVKTPASKFAKDRRLLQKATSDPYIEKKIRESKKVAGFGNIDLAHRSSMRQNKRLGTKILSDTLGLDPPEVNRKIIKPLENKLEKLYQKQSKLVKKIKKEGTSSTLRKQLETVNKQVSDVVAKTDGRLQGILVDEINLKPKIIGIDYSKSFGAGVIPTKPISKMTPYDIELGVRQMKGQMPIVKQSDLKSTQMLNRLNNQLSMNPLPAEELSKASSAVARGLKNLKLLRPLGYQTGVGGALIGPLDFLGGRPVSEILLDIPTLGIAGQSLRAQRLKQTVGPEVFDKIQEQRAARSEGVGGIESTMFEDFGVDETPLEEAIQARADREAEVAKTRKIQDVSEMDIMGLPNALKKDREQEIKRDESLDVDDTEFL
jgi:hypothetical protein